MFLAGAGLAALLGLVLFLGVGHVLKWSRTPGGRYRLAVDPASRHSFRYVQDRVTKRWVNREFELRVRVERALPEPLTDAEHGDRLSVQLLTSMSAQSGGLDASLPVVADGWRTWHGRDVLHEDDLRGQTSYSVSVQWPVEGESTRYDDAEIFRLPPLGNLPPDAWSDWATADDRRPGAFGWWEEVHGAPRDTTIARPAWPFEFRYRLFLSDIPGFLP